MLLEPKGGYYTRMTRDTMNALKKHLLDQGLGEITECQAVAGGDICTSEKLTTSSGQLFFLKTLASAPADLFPAEAAGLAAIASTATVTIPEVIYADSDCLLLEYLPTTTLAPDYWPTLGRQLALMHQQPQPNFGFDCDNYCGKTPQPNPPTEDGFEFFSDHRLLYQARLARDAGHLNRTDCNHIESLGTRLAELVPAQPPSLLHGDLWSGNIHNSATGTPVLIDPACYRGWAEADLAMTCLFGNLPEPFYQAYAETNPLHPGWQQRLVIYNLYHLLNHVNLFGAGYLAAVRRILNRFT